MSYTVRQILSSVFDIAAEKLKVIDISLYNLLVDVFRGRFFLDCTLPLDAGDVFVGEVRDATYHRILRVEVSGDQPMDVVIREADDPEMTRPSITKVLTNVKTGRAEIKLSAQFVRVIVQNVSTSPQSELWIRSSLQNV